MFVFPGIMSTNTLNQPNSKFVGGFPGKQFYAVCLLLNFNQCQPASLWSLSSIVALVITYTVVPFLPSLETAPTSISSVNDVLHGFLLSIFICYLISLTYQLNFLELNSLYSDSLSDFIFNGLLIR